MQYIATFVPQKLIPELGGDFYPAEPEGSTEWDCTDFLMDEYAPDERLEIVEDEWGSELTDSVRNDPSAPAWIRDWDGPFEVKVEIRHQ